MDNVSFEVSRVITPAISHTDSWKWQKRPHRVIELISASARATGQERVRFHSPFAYKSCVRGGCRRFVLPDGQFEILPQQNKTKETLLSAIRKAVIFARCCRSHMCA